MSDKKYPIITISREYGAGGRSIARGISDRLGIPFYDRDFVKKTAEQSGYSVEDIEQEGENMSHAGKFMNDFLNNAVSYTSSHDGIFLAQKATILDLAKEDCIIIGRCSNIILREAGIPSFDVFLHADIVHRMKRAQQLNENEDTEMDLQKYVEKRDDLRETYYKSYTGHVMGDYHDYDISLDSGALGYDACIELLANLIEKHCRLK